MELKACPLCLYQRVFVMGAAAVLWVGLPQRGIPAGILSALAAPLAAWKRWTEDERIDSILDPNR